jgi:hypothetical protein
MSWTCPRHPGVWRAVCSWHPLLDSFLSRYYGALHRLLASIFPDFHHLSWGYCPQVFGFCLVHCTVPSRPGLNADLLILVPVSRGNRGDRQKFFFFLNGWAVFLQTRFRESEEHPGFRDFDGKAPFHSGEVVGRGHEDANSANAFQCARKQDVTNSGPNFAIIRVTRWVCEKYPKM